MKTNPIASFKIRSSRLRSLAALMCGTLLFTLASAARADDSPALRERLKASGFKIAWESYVGGNSEIFVIGADGSDAANLTRTPSEHEHYPQVAPDGKKICFNVDAGEGRTAVRSLWMMDIDGKNRKKIADNAREPFWSPDGKVIGYLPQEYPKFNVIDYYTKGLVYYHLDTGASENHPNAEKLHHLYHPRFSPNGKWVVSTVHAGMGCSHAILLIEAHGDKIINLKIKGCRPTISSDGKHIAWGEGDHDLTTAPLDTDSENPSVGPVEFRIKDSKKKIYHIAWSPDGKFVSFSRGPDGEGDLTKTGTFQAACEIIGVYAKDWDLYAVAVGTGVLDLNTASEKDVVRLTSDGNSNKEPCWIATGK